MGWMGGCISSCGLRGLDKLWIVDMTVEGNPQTRPSRCPRRQGSRDRCSAEQVGVTKYHPERASALTLKYREYTTSHLRSTKRTSPLPYPPHIHKPWPPLKPPPKPQKKPSTRRLTPGLSISGYVSIHLLPTPPHGNLNLNPNVNLNCKT